MILIARVLSTYTLGFMGAAGLVGAPLAGFLVAWVGPLGACAAAGGTMLAVVTVLALATPLTSVE